MALEDAIIGAESGGNPTARNPNSSAAGLGQFIDGTWLSMMAKNRPDLVEGKSRDEILALRNDPALSREMTGAYARDNSKALTDAGLPATPGNTYLAHFAGPQGAVNVLKADPSATAGAVLGDAVVKANPFLRGMTVADLQAWAAKKVGGGGPAAQPPVGAISNSAGMLSGSGAPAAPGTAPSVPAPDDSGQLQASLAGIQKMLAQQQVQAPAPIDLSATPQPPAMTPAMIRARQLAAAMRARPLGA